LNSSTIAAGIRFFLQLISKAEWKFVPPEDLNEADKARAGTLITETKKILFKEMQTSWHRIVRRTAMYRFYGFSVQEWTAVRRPDGSIGFLDIEVRPQRTCERWDTNRQGDVLGVLQRPPQRGFDVYIPREKLVYLVDDSLSDSPEGVGLLRHLIDPATRLKTLERLEGYGYEGDLRGVPIVRAPLGALNQAVQDGTISKELRAEILQPLENFIKEHIKNPALGMLLDSQPWRTIDESARPSNIHQYEIELLDGGEYSFEQVDIAIKRIQLELARILNIEHLLLGSDSTGSFALSRDKSSNFGLVVDSSLKEIREAYQRDLIRPLWQLNGWPEELMPTLMTDSSASRDIGQIAAVFRELGSVGLKILREDEAVQEIFRMLGLPPLPALTEEQMVQLGIGPQPVATDPTGLEAPPELE
jgi:hypothetical protein